MTLAASVGNRVMLLDDIIARLSDESTSLSGALLKTKVLLHQIGKRELAGWVNNELNGYPSDDDALPAYRIVPSYVTANVWNPVYRYENHPLPIRHLPPEGRKHLEHAYMFDSLAVLEDMTKRAKKEIITRPIPMEYNAILGENLGNEYQVESARCIVAVHDIKGMSSHVRSRLLDFLLELKDTVGSTSSVEELREKVTEFDAGGMFTKAMFGAGSNINILFGNQSTITANQTTMTGSQLAERVRGLVEQVEPLLPNLPASVREDSQHALSELREAATVGAPDIGRLRRGLESLQHVMEHATGHVVANGVLALIAELLSRAAH
jgi:hypothetical protein